MNLEYFGISNCGPYRAINQDCFCCANTLYANVKRVSLSAKKTLETPSEPIVFAVADGMGGHEAGEEASRFAIERFCEKVEFLSDRGNELENSISRIIEEVHSELNQHGVLIQHPDMGTTLTGVVIIQEKVISFHVGDSRLYLYNQKSCKIGYITEDHSLAYEKKSGVFKHFLTSCIGGGVPKIRVDVLDLTEKIQKGDILILTTDGLHEVLENEFFEDLLIENKDTSKFCKIAIQESLFRESQDNLTILTIKF